MQLSRLLISGLFVFLISGFSYGEDTQGKSNSKPSNQSQKRKAITNKIPINVQITPSNLAKNDRDYCKNNSEWKIGDKINALLVLITAVLAFFTYGLFKETKKLADSADFVSRAELKAYISVGSPIDGKFVPELEEDGINKIALLVVKNTGKTPAFEIQGNARASILPLELKDFKYPLVDDIDGSVFTLSAGEDIDLPVSIEQSLTPAEGKTLIDSTDQRIYIYGTIVFKDVFWRDGQEKRRTNFCFRVDHTRTDATHDHRLWKRTNEHNEIT